MAPRIFTSFTKPILFLCKCSHIITYLDDIQVPDLFKVCLQEGIIFFVLLIGSL